MQGGDFFLERGEKKERRSLIKGGVLG